MKQSDNYCTKQDQQRSLTSSTIRNNSYTKKVFSNIILITIIIISLLLSIPIICLGVVLTLSQPAYSTKQQQQQQQQLQQHQQQHLLSPISWFTKMLSPMNENEQDIVTEITGSTMEAATQSTTETVPEKLYSEIFNIQFDSTKTGNVHIIILVHGIFGNSKELNYLEKMIHENVVSTQDSNNDDHWIIHSVTSNVGLTLDGIAAGGSRIAIEINNLLTMVQKKYTKFLLTTTSTTTGNSNNNKITLSLVGHSLGGLYSRYAISEIDFINNPNIIPAVFCTIACPHLGVSDYTYIKLPRFLEGAVATGLKQTGNDLFRYSTLLDTMITDTQFIQPLQNFYHRRAYANAYNTDLQVPFRTSAFLSNTDSIHYYRTTITNDTTTTTTQSKSTTSDEKDDTNNDKNFVALVVETKKQILDNIHSKSGDVADTDTADAAVCNDRTVNDSGEHQQTSSTSTTATSVDVTSSNSKLTGDEIAIRLDSFGWTKIFCDMRETVTSIPKPISMYQSMSQFSTQCYNLLQAPLQSSTRTVVKESKSNSALSTSAKSQLSNSETNDGVTTSSEDVQKQQQEQQTTTSAMKQKDSYTASELIQQYSDCNDRWHLPYGHSTIVANSKAEWYAELNAAGRPMVKRIAQDLLYVIPQAVVHN